MDFYSQRFPSWSVHRHTHISFWLSYSGPPAAGNFKSDSKIECFPNVSIILRIGCTPFIGYNTVWNQHRTSRVIIYREKKNSDTKCFTTRLLLQQHKCLTVFFRNRPTRYCSRVRFEIRTKILHYWNLFRKGVTAVWKVITRFNWWYKGVGCNDFQTVLNRSLNNSIGEKKKIQKSSLLKIYRGNRIEQSGILWWKNREKKTPCTVNRYTVLLFNKHYTQSSIFPIVFMRE